MEQASEGSVAVQVTDGVTVIVLRGEHDLSNLPMVQEALAEGCSAGPTIVDLTDAEFIDSSMLGVLVGQRSPSDTVLEWSRLAIVMPSEGRVASVLRPGRPGRDRADVSVRVRRDGSNSRRGSTVVVADVR